MKRMDVRTLRVLSTTIFHTNVKMGQMAVYLFHTIYPFLKMPLKERQAHFVGFWMTIITCRLSGSTFMGIWRTEKSNAIY